MRVTIPQPEQFLFTTSYKVNITDLNYGGHVGNDKFLAIAHECRVQFFEHLGVTEKNIGEETGIIMANTIINYKAEAFYGDVLTAKVGVTNIGRSSFALVYHLHKKEQLVAEILTTIVAINKEKAKPKSIPQSFLDKLTTVCS